MEANTENASADDLYDGYVRYVEGLRGLRRHRDNRLIAEFRARGKGEDSAIAELECDRELPPTRTSEQFEIWWRQLDSTTREVLSERFRTPLEVIRGQAVEQVRATIERRRPSC